MCLEENTRKIKISASQLIFYFFYRNYDHGKKFRLLKFYSGYRKFNLNSPKGYSLKIINAQTDHDEKTLFMLISLNNNIIHYELY